MSSSTVSFIPAFTPTWASIFVQRYHLGEIGIGLALLGYGIPGLLLGPLIGRAADRLGTEVA